MTSFSSVNAAISQSARNPPPPPVASCSSRAKPRSPSILSNSEDEFEEEFLDNTADEMEQRLVQGLHVYEHMEAGLEEVAAIANDISVNIEDMFQNDPKGTLQHKYVPYIQQLEVCRPFRPNDFAGKRWTTSEKKATLLTAIGYRRGDLLEFSMACESC